MTVRGASTEASERSDPRAATPGRTGSALSRRDARAALAVATVFLLSRALVRAAGVRFDASGLDWYWQFLDPPLLAHRLLESVVHLHSAPPLFNVFLGVVLKVFPADATAIFHATFLVSGLTLVLSMFFLMRELAVPRAVSAAVALAFAVSPSAVLYENWLFYTYPTAALLCVAALCLTIWARRHLAVAAVACGGALCCLALTTAFFHLIWLLAALGVIRLGGRLGWRRAALVVVAPIVVVGAWYVKNLVLFGRLSASSWMGMNIAKIVESNLDTGRREQLVRSGRISRLAEIRPFSPLMSYVADVSELPKTGVPALDLVTKSSGVQNFNHLAYVEISRTYLRDSLRVVVLSPAAYLKGVILATTYYFQAGSEYFMLGDNRAKIAPYERMFDRFVYGRLGGSGFLPEDRPDRQIADEPWKDQVRRAASGCGAVIVIGTALWLAVGFKLAVRAVKRRGDIEPWEVGLLFLWLNIAYATAAGTLLELGENGRFRFMVEPLLWSGLAAWLSRLWQHRRALASPAVSIQPEM
ncbi:MAG TPA: hypothetical protein VMT45_12440 [Thermoanaerobaculaceae bacterium]|nr:hypothetical protein [Thermoanaerobaculaceae bacterium]